MILLVDNFGLSEEEKAKVIEEAGRQPVYFNDADSVYWAMDFKVNGLWYSMDRYTDSAPEQITIRNFQ